MREIPARDASGTGGEFAHGLRQFFGEEESDEQSQDGCAETDDEGLSSHVRDGSERGVFVLNRDDAETRIVAEFGGRVRAEHFDFAAIAFSREGRERGLHLRACLLPVLHNFKVRHRTL